MFCDKCGENMPENLMACPKCGYTNPPCGNGRIPHLPKGNSHDPVPSEFQNTFTKQTMPLGNGCVNMICGMFLSFFISSMLIFTEMVTGDAARMLPGICALFLLPLCFFCCQHDNAELTSRGADTTQTKPWTWLTPIYLHQRNKITGEVFPYSLLCSISLGLALLSYLF